MLEMLPMEKSRQLRKNRTNRPQCPITLIHIYDKLAKI